MTTSQEFTIDAAGKKLGRIATEAATILRGKNSPDFAPHKESGNKVTIINAGQADISAAKMQEEYTRYSGYPGGLIHETREHLVARKGIAPVFEKAVYGMLPANRLRARLMKNLTIKE